ncbi:hypothetical protein AVEN_207079-1 [Araneus ventricosus]|uniref:Uncharacterized protein n=1 Tax=Araneus ventricosus TaxID=182803 RepID=A0A4Y2GCH7_ARAVE|nr:hypothetical protein AVEN_207079-1 [Araneus ventricosus]
MNSNNQCLYTAACSTLLVDRRHHKEGGSDLHKISIQDVARCRDDATGTPPSVTTTLRERLPLRVTTSDLCALLAGTGGDDLEEKSSRKRCSAFSLSINTVVGLPLISTVKTFSVLERTL